MFDDMTAGSVSDVASEGAFRRCHSDSIGDILEGRDAVQYLPVATGDRGAIGGNLRGGEPNDPGIPIPGLFNGLVVVAEFA